MLIELIVGQLFLAIFNIANVYVDAYLIFNKKTVGHVANFCTYALLTATLCALFSLPAIAIVLFCVSAFLNRQFSFDIPLNLRRKLPWYYQTKDTSANASLLDRIERRVFGNGENVGKRIARAYFIAYCVTIILWIWLI